MRRPSNGSPTLIIRRAPIGFTLEGINVETGRHAFGQEVPLDAGLAIVVRDTRERESGHATVASSTASTGEGLVEPASSSAEEDTLL
jgi:hypothetical protein